MARLRLLFGGLASVSDEIEAGGALATAALAADALQPAAARQGPHAENCANCGAVLAGPFCGQCGQRAHLHRSLGDVVHEIVHGVTHFDGRLWATLPLLLYRPGKLIRSYVDGQRARYIAPVPLFLMVVFLMFFVLSFVGFNDNVGTVQVGGIEQGGAEQGKTDLAKALADIDRDLAAARKAGDTAEAKRLEGVRGVVATLGRQAAAGDAGISDRLSEEIISANARGGVNVDTGVPWLDEKAKAALKNPKLLLYKLQTKAYKLSFLLVPLSLPWLWLVLFWRRKADGVRVTMYDHAIFALYSISFISLLFIAGSLLLSANIVSQFVWIPILLAPAAHMFASLRGTYALGPWEAGWRTIYLSVAAMMSLSAYLVILLVLGLLD
jgi:hypothetical protein